MYSSMRIDMDTGDGSVIIKTKRMNCLYYGVGGIVSIFHLVAGKGGT